MYAGTLPGPEKQPQLRDFVFEDDIQLQMQVGPQEIFVLLLFSITSNNVNDFFFF